MGRCAPGGVAAGRTEDLARAALGAGGLEGWGPRQARALLGTGIHALSPGKRAGKEGSEDTAVWDAWWEWEWREPALGKLSPGWQHPTSYTHHSHHYLVALSFACICSTKI